MIDSDINNLYNPHEKCIVHATILAILIGEIED